jgi:hypothetical protein
MRAAWSSQTTLIAEFDGIAGIGASDFKLQFEGETVIFNAKDRTCESGIQTRGTALKDGG